MAKRLFVDSIWKSANKEGLEITFSKTATKNSCIFSAKMVYYISKENYL